VGASGWLSLFDEPWSCEPWRSCRRRFAASAFEARRGSAGSLRSRARLPHSADATAACRLGRSSLPTPARMSATSAPTPSDPLPLHRRHSFRARHRGRGPWTVLRRCVRDPVEALATRTRRADDSAPPVRDQPPGMALALGPPVPDTIAPRVLLIDDDPGVRDSVQALLEYFGYECGIAADGPSGLKRFEGQTCDLVMTDLMPPGMTGGSEPTRGHSRHARATRSAARDRAGSGRPVAVRLS